MDTQLTATIDAELARDLANVPSPSALGLIRDRYRKLAIRSREWQLRCIREAQGYQSPRIVRECIEAADRFAESAVKFERLADEVRT